MVKHDKTPHALLRKISAFLGNVRLLYPINAQEKVNVDQQPSPKLSIGERRKISFCIVILDVFSMLKKFMTKKRF